MALKTFDYETGLAENFWNDAYIKPAYNAYRFATVIATSKCECCKLCGCETLADAQKTTHGMYRGSDKTCFCYTMTRNIK